MARDCRETQRGACRRERGDGRHGRGYVHPRATWDERVRARGRRRLPHLFRVCARARRSLGHVPVARSRAAWAQRDRNVVAPSRRVRKAGSNVVSLVGTVAAPESSRAILSGRASERTFLAASALLFATSATVTILWSASMSAM